MTESVKEIWGMACPNCGDCLRIDVSANIWVRLSPDGSDPYEAKIQDHEWSNDSPAFCGTCGHPGTVATFSKAGSQP